MAAVIWPTAHIAAGHARASAVAPLTPNPYRHLLSRFAFGPSSASLRGITAVGADRWWADQIAYGRAHGGYTASARIAAHGSLLARSPAEVRAWLKARGNEYGWDAMDRLGEVTLGLQAWSTGQVYEAVVDFFANHLNVANHNGDLWHTRHTMDRDVIRRHALGTFTDMLLAAGRNPAMMLYLNNAESDQRAVNENYGRELLELHTVGLGAGYTEEHVKNSARILTGRTFNWETNAYGYDPARHWTGPVSVLGFTHANISATGGEAVGDAYLRYLAGHPSTATNLARKLCVRFVSDAPSAELVAAVADVYRRNGTAIVPTITAIIRSAEFWESRGRKVRRPVENLIASLRALDLGAGTDIAKPLQALSWMSASMNDRPLDWAPPNGYPDVAAAWRSSGTLLTTWQYHRALSQWWREDRATFNWPASTSYYAPARPATSGAAIDALTLRLTGMRFSPAPKAALQTFLQEPASTPIATSNLRWWLPHLIPLILDAPHHALR